MGRYLAARILKVIMLPQCMISKGSHAKFAHFVLLSVSEKAKHDYILIFFIQCIIKQLSGSAFGFS